MLRVGRACGAAVGGGIDGLRTFATAKSPSFLSAKLVKAAIGEDDEVASSFVDAFAPLVHRHPVTVEGVRRSKGPPQPQGADMQHDVKLRYTVRGEGAARLHVVPGDGFGRVLAELQQMDERYLPARALRHAGSHFLDAVSDKASDIKAERARTKEEAKRAAAAAEAAGQEPAKAPRTLSSVLHTAYVNAEPVHLLMLSSVCYAYSGAWRATASAPAPGMYSWMAPLFSTFRLSSAAGNLPLVPGEPDPGSTGYAQQLASRLSITTVHLPLVPRDVRDTDAWHKVVALEEHRAALEKPELREWLHFLAHSEVQGRELRVAEGLEGRRVFRRAIWQAVEMLGPKPVGFSPKEVMRAVENAKKEAVENARKEIMENALRERKESMENALREQEEAVAAARAAVKAELKDLRAQLERLSTDEGRGRPA